MLNQEPPRKHADTAFFPTRPCLTFARCTRIVPMPTVLHPLPHVPVHIVQSIPVRPEGTHRRRLVTVPATPATPAVRSVLPYLLPPCIRRQCPPRATYSHSASLSNRYPSPVSLLNHSTNPWRPPSLHLSPVGPLVPIPRHQADVLHIPHPPRTCPTPQMLPRTSHRKRLPYPHPVPRPLAHRPPPPRETPSYTPPAGTTTILGHHASSQSRNSRPAFHMNSMKSKGVVPPLSFAFTSAPRLTSSSTALRAFFRAARCSNVSP